MAATAAADVLLCSNVAFDAELRAGLCELLDTLEAFSTLLHQSLKRDQRESCSLPIVRLADSFIPIDILFSLLKYNLHGYLADLAVVLASLCACNEIERRAREIWQLFKRSTARYRYCQPGAILYSLVRLELTRGDLVEVSRAAQRTAQRDPLRPCSAPSVSAFRSPSGFVDANVSDQQMPF